MSVRVIHSGKHAPAWLRGSLEWHRCVRCGALWDRLEPRAIKGGKSRSVCDACRRVLRAQSEQVLR